MEFLGLVGFESHLSPAVATLLNAKPYTSEDEPSRCGPERCRPGEGKIRAKRRERL
jgi:hypothetical protein